MIQANSYEKPDAGSYVGVVVDVVQLGWKDNKNPQYPGPGCCWIKLVWLLNRNDSTGKPFRVSKSYTKKIGPKSRLFSAATDILGVPPGIVFDEESFLGRANKLYLAKEANQQNPQDPWVNVKAIMPLEAGDVIPQIPSDFVREKNRTGYVEPSMYPKAPVPVQPVPTAPQGYQQPPQQMPPQWQQNPAPNTQVPTQQVYYPPQPPANPVPQAAPQYQPPAQQSPIPQPQGGGQPTQPNPQATVTF